MTTKKGIVSATKMTGTITVTVDQLVKHPVYQKLFRKSKKFLADLGSFADVVVGDEVLIQECRPLSKRKHFRLIEVLKRCPRVSEVREDAMLESVINRKKTVPSAA